MADENILIEVDASIPAIPKLEKVKKKLDEGTKASGLMSTALGDMTEKLESAGVPIQGFTKYLGAMGAGGLAAGAVAGLGAVAVGMGALSFNTIQATADLKDLSDQTGLSVETLSSMKNVLATSNLDTKTFADAISKLSINLSKSKDEFKKLGISTSDPLKAFEELRTKISQTTDPLERARLGNLAFSKSFTQLMPMLTMAQDEYDALRESSAKITTQQAEDAAKLADQWDLMKTKIGGAATEVGLSMMPAMSSLFNLFEKFLPIITGTLDVFGQMASGLITLSTSIVSAISKAFTPLFEYLDKIWNKAKDVLGLAGEVANKPTYRSEGFIKAREKMQSGLTPEQAKLMGFNPEITSEQIRTGWQAPKPSTPIPPSAAEESKVRTQSYLSQIQATNSGVLMFNKAQKDQNTFFAPGFGLLSDQEKAKIEEQKKISEENAQWQIDLNTFVMEEQIKAEEEALEKEKRIAEERKALYQSYADAVSSNLKAPFETMFKELSRGELKIQNTLESIGRNFGNTLASMLAELASKAVIFGLFNLISGGAFGAATGGFSIGKALGFAANGSDYLPAGWTVVGERGPELIYNDKPGAKVVSNEKISQNSKTINVTNNIVVREVTPKALIESTDRYQNRYAKFGVT